MDEPEVQVRERMNSIFARIITESAEGGPTGLVSHGGPITLLLLELGMNKDELARYRKMFDTTNPLPPAGVWKVEQVSGEGHWSFQLVFMSNVNHSEG